MSLAERSLFSSNLFHLRKGRNSRAVTPTGLQFSQIDGLDLEFAQRQQLEGFNVDLQTLCEVFPDVQPEVLRARIASFSGDSRRHVIAETILRSQAKYSREGIKCRCPPRTPAGSLSACDLFRTGVYKTAVLNCLVAEFKSLSRSTIEEVLVERNHAYVEARTILTGLSVRSLRASMVNFLARRKPLTNELHPMIFWSHEQNECLARPVLKSSCSDELDREIEEEYLAPLLDELHDKMEIEDHQIAQNIHSEEAVSASMINECQCCFDRVSVEETLFCDKEAHQMCGSCVEQMVREAVYGQAWAQTVNLERHTLYCGSISLNSGCGGVIPSNNVKNMLGIHRPGRLLWERFESKIMEDNLKRCGIKLLKCPSCPYAEEGSVPIPHVKFRTNWLLITGFFFVVITFTMFSAIKWVYPISRMQLVLCQVFLTLLITGASCTLHYNASLGTEKPKFYESVTPPALSGRKFICRNPSCLRTSCLSCQSPWVDPHQCNDDAKLSLDRFVEAAITNAVKRTCPECSLSFIKSSGCNKLQCPCGHAMCYLCRADLTQEGYKHYCPHFRPEGGPCTECTRCELYKDEDDDEILRTTKQMAEDAWWEQNGPKLPSVRTEGTSTDQSVLSRLFAMRKFRGI